MVKQMIFFCVGTLYRSRNEPVLALDFFKRAAAAGNDRANHFIGDIYAYGIGVPKDAELAKQYYEKSSKHGFFIGKTRLLHLRRSEGGIAANLVFLMHFPFLIIEVVLVYLRNPKDARLIDIPECKHSTR